MKLEMTFTSPAIVLDDGEIIEAESANLYVDSLGVPQLLQVVGGKQPITIPWREVYKISHA